MEYNDGRKGYIARVKDRKIEFRSEEEIKRQLQNCYEAIRKYQEKQKNNPYKNKFEKRRIIKKEDTNTNLSSSSSSSSRPVRYGHQRQMGGIRKDNMLSPKKFEPKQKMEKENNRVKRTVSSMLGDIKNLTPDERSKAGGMLEALEQNKEHKRGHNRGRGR